MIMYPAHAQKQQLQQQLQQQQQARRPERQRPFSSSSNSTCSSSSSSALRTHSDWAIESIDFGSLEDFTKEPLPSMLNNCSAAETLSTEGESYSEWEDDCECSDSAVEDSFFHECATTTVRSLAATGNTAVTTATATIPEEEEEENNDNYEESESSLDLEDLTAFAKEDEVGIYDPVRRDELPPPKPRTNFKGDSQKSFTLDDLEFFNEDQRQQRSRNQYYQRSNSQDHCMTNEVSFCLEELSFGSSFSKDNTKANDKATSQTTISEKKKPLKGILKNASSSRPTINEEQTTHTNASLAMKMMENSGMFNLSLNGSFEMDFYEDDRNEDDNNDNHDYDSSENNTWTLMQQSFARDCTVMDLQQAIEESQDKNVSFSSVSIYEHPLICGDNPSVSEGVPLTIDWNAESTRTFKSIEEYEENRQQTRMTAHTAIKKENQTVLKREAQERLWLLLDAGISLKEIQHAEMMVNIAREQREATKQQHLLILAEKSAAFSKAIQAKEEEEEQCRLSRRQRNRGRFCAVSKAPDKDAMRQTRRTTLVVSPERTDYPTGNIA